MASLVYSTDSGRHCSRCGLPAAQCQCRSQTDTPAPPADGIVRVRREIKGRRGKTVTMIMGLSQSEAVMTETAKAIKQHLGTGGSVKEGRILIQGDHVSKVIPWLENQGFRVKRAGG